MKKRMSPKAPYSSPSPSPSSSRSPFPKSKLPFFPHGRVHEDGNGCIEHKVRSGSTPSSGPQKRAAAADHGMPPVNRKGEVVSVSCDGCRPQYAWEGKISVVPLEYGGRGLNNAVPMSIPSPSHAFKMFISSLSRRSPVTASGSRTNRTVDEDYCKTALDELSRKLIDTTRERDDALLKVSNLKHSMVELEKKLNQLEEYCYSLKSSLYEHQGTSAGSLFQMIHRSPSKLTNKNLVVNNGKSAELFVLAVSEAEECVKTLSRLLVLELPGAGSNAYETVSRLVRTYGMNVSNSTNRMSLIIYFEAILNAIFFEDFETSGFQKNAGSPMLNPIELCLANLVSYKALKSMTWEGVLEKGTRYYCGGFSGFCDRKMSNIIGRFGWRRAWSEALLVAFFEASKSIWLVHLLANSIHPGFLIFRVHKGADFDPVYMVDLGQNSEDQMSGSAIVQAMVSPGFYVQDSVVKCKVICPQQL